MERRIRLLPTTPVRVISESSHGLWPALALALALAACATVPAPPALAPPPPLPPPPLGLARILGAAPPAVVALLGPASRDAREGPARLLQFIRPLCVLDVYFYPGASGAFAVRTAAARRPDGSRLDPGACLGLLAPPG